jgi:hypothetical protein
VRSAVRDLAIVLAISWLARLAFIAAIGDAHSLDVDYWRGALSAQDEGHNPYETDVLNWPPFWLQIIVVLDAAAAQVGISFLSALRIYLVLVESAIVVTLYFTLVSVGAQRGAVRRALLVGIALNPVMIILVCQHGNSDVNVGLLVTLAAAALIAHRRSRDVVLWLCGCLLLGLGVLAKTTPLVLAPVLAPGARLASRTGRVPGLTLLLGPALLGLSVIAALVPRAVLDHVISYRSTRGFWGFAGVLDEVTVINNRYAAGSVVVLLALAALAWWWGRRPPNAVSARTCRYLVAAAVLMVSVVVLVELLDRLGFDARSRYDNVFTLAVVSMASWLGYRLFHEEPPTAERLFLLIAVVFMVVVAFGPGYGAHYAPWFLPALIATYVLLDDNWRWLLRIGYVIAGLTYAIEYGVIPFLGAWAVAMFGSSEWITDVGEYLIVPHRWVLFRIPLFVVYVVVIAAGSARLAERRRSEPVA